MKSSIALVGFMGTGKSTVGRALAQRLNCQFVDSDSAVAEKAGMTVPQIFERLGECAFRKTEAEVISNLCAMENAVIAIGGGAVDNRSVRETLRRNCTVVLLTADLATILERTAGETGRPLLDGFDIDERRARVLELMHARTRAYNEVYDITVDTGGQVAEVVDAIVSGIRSATDERAATCI